MRLSQLFNLAIKLGKERDPRKDKGAIKSYPDSALLYGRRDAEIKKFMVGIDIESAELLLAEKIREREGLDLVVAHHPEGSAFASLHEVMQLQVELLKKMGVAEGLAQKLLDERMWEVERRILPNNHSRAVDTARLLGMPFINLHTPADNHAFYFMQELMRKKKPAYVKDIVDILLEVPEYRRARQELVGPRIILGSPKRKVGKILVEMTGGTEGSRDVFDKLYRAGVRTLICMHLSEDHLKKVKDASLNVVIAGHISSDTLGLNLLLDRLQKRSGERFEIIACSGFRRVIREK
ncbi:MAG TPA: NGG1p interacting factor NIF3 [Candidatus Margulisiibacteriota bacterium]|nr:NGG1p interacting factor NIF3 [Candidatus Margulisiibacteriota bacterium]